MLKLGTFGSTESKGICLNLSYGERKKRPKYGRLIEN